MLGVGDRVEERASRRRPRAGRAGPSPRTRPRAARGSAGRSRSRRCSRAPFGMSSAKRRRPGGPAGKPRRRTSFRRRPRGARVEDAPRGPAPAAEASTSALAGAERGPRARGRGRSRQEEASAAGAATAMSVVSSREQAKLARPPRTRQNAPGRPVRWPCAMVAGVSGVLPRDGLLAADPGRARGAAPVGGARARHVPGGRRDDVGHLGRRGAALARGGLLAAAAALRLPPARSTSTSSGVPFALFGSLAAVKYAQCLVGRAPRAGARPPRAARLRRARGSRRRRRSRPSTPSSSGSRRTSGRRRVFTVLLWWAIERLLAADARGSTAAAAAAGLLWGLAILTRETVLYFLPLAALWLAWRRPRRRAARGRSSSPRRCSSSLPWTLRNWLVFDAFVPVSTAGALNLWQGNTRLSRQEVYEEYWAVRGRIPKYEHARQPRDRGDPRAPAPVDPREAARRDAGVLGGARPAHRPPRARGLRRRRAARCALAAVAVVLCRTSRCSSSSWSGSRRCRAGARRSSCSRFSRSTCCSTWPRTATRATACRRCPPSSSWRRTASWPARAAATRGATARTAPRRGRGGARARALGRAEPVAWVTTAVAAALVRGRRGRAGPGRRAGGAEAGEAVRPSRAIPLALLLAVVVRVPFWIEALQTPVDGDTAIVGLMARHPGRGDDVLGPALRLAARLVGGAALRRGLGPHHRGAAPAVLPARSRSSSRSPTRSRASCTPRPACPPPCSSPARRPTSCCSSALPPPFYPTTLVLCGLVLLTAAQAGRRLDGEHAHDASRRLRGARS